MKSSTKPKKVSTKSKKVSPKTATESANSELVFGHQSNQINGSLTAMQLSTVAYCKNLQKTLHHYLPTWDVVWESTHEINGNNAFIAKSGNQYAVSIRGSILNFSWAAFYNWFYQDFNIFTQVAWPYKQSTGSSKPMISQGSMNGLNNLNQLKNSSGETIINYLIKNVGSSDSLLITGHSLGANLATVLAPFINYQYKTQRIALPNMSVMTFAAATAGNKDFATEYDALFPNSWRFYNSIDIVPHGANTIGELALLYPPPAPSASNIGITFNGYHVTMAEAFLTISGIIYASEYSYGSYYTHTNMQSGSIQLNTSKQIFPVTGTDPAELWFKQAGQQHATAHYLQFLGGSPVLCQA